MTELSDILSLVESRRAAVEAARAGLLHSQLAIDETLGDLHAEASGWKDKAEVMNKWWGVGGMARRVAQIAGHVFEEDDENAPSVVIVMHKGMSGLHRGEVGYVNDLLARYCVHIGWAHVASEAEIDAEVARIEARDTPRQYADRGSGLRRAMRIHDGQQTKRVPDVLPCSTADGLPAWKEGGVAAVAV